MTCGVPPPPLARRLAARALHVGLALGGLAASDLAAQALTAPIPLTRSPGFAEQAVHVSGNGLVFVFPAGIDSASSDHPRIVGDLRGTCSARFLQRHHHDLEPSPAHDPHAHPTVSADGSRIAYAIQVGSEGSEREYELRLLEGGVETVLRTVKVLTNDLSVLRPTLSADGSVLYYTDSDVSVPPDGLSRLRRLEVDTLVDCQFGPERSLSAVSTFALTQSASSADGRFAVYADGSDVLRFDFDSATVNGDTCENVVELTVASGVAAVEDVTVSGDGRTIAWTSPANYATGALDDFFNPWIWREGAADSPGVDCVDSGGGRLCRPFTIPDDAAHDARPFVTSDGRRAFFISSANYFTLNFPAKPRLWVVDLTADPWGVKNVSDQFDPTDHVQFATADADGTTAIVRRWRPGPTPDFDLFLLEMADVLPPATPVPALARPADLPFEVEVTGCAPNGLSPTVTATVRQHSGGPRRLLIVLEARAAGGSPGHLGAFVQAIDDGEQATLTRGVPVPDGTPGTAATCRAIAWDTDAFQADVTFDDW